MKKTIKYFACILAAGAWSQTTEAQSLTANETKPTQHEIYTLDSTRNQRMETDLNKRNSMSKNHPVRWKESGNGFNGTYSSNNVQYMARYDNDGDYMETFTKKEWNENAPAKLRSSFAQSDYKTQRVTEYWEVTDPNRRGYYLELRDDLNKPSTVWVNEEGKFSTSPSNVNGEKKNKNMYLVPDSTMKKDH
jgi:lipopolysaccharide export LptBFGC system permease protein LptF